LGTPEDDDSTHRISQKAIESIASIGGGGVSDLLSRSFLGIFSNFYYSKLGFGCYLHQGVCQLMGVEVVDNGFYLVKGAGLPRIDVIGYNPELDWDILVNRLSRITTSDEVIIE
ncbi:MAG: C4-dicarboxylate ABC transporter, partial [Methyloprofundus sp.]|nr:C4-dicarboxylate ABC transporter [Methyloprofundus sp.]